MRSRYTKVDRITRKCRSGWRWTFLIARSLMVLHYSRWRIKTNTRGSSRKLELFSSSCPQRSFNSGVYRGWQLRSFESCIITPMTHCRRWITPDGKDIRSFFNRATTEHANDRGLRGSLDKQLGVANSVTIHEDINKAWKTIGRESCWPFRYAKLSLKAPRL